MGRRIRSNVRQYSTHGQLVGRARPSAWRTSGAPLDAIVVPASRPAANLDQAVTLARAARCRLVVFCSLEARPDDVRTLLAARGFNDAVVVDLRQGYRHELLDFNTTHALPEGFANPNGDLSTKRNLGLLLARMAGWKRIFFLDDDIRDLAPQDLLVTVSMLDRYRSAGLRVDDFPDNSVVCHARRKTGDSQDVFVTGSVLAVNCAEPFGFFPDIYNEDWLFFYEDARAGLLGSSGRQATQLRYDPFGNPQRATQQEFGDVLAEGLYGLLHTAPGLEGATLAYWQNFLAARRMLLHDIKERAGAMHAADREQLTLALDSAIACLDRIKPEMCREYVDAWQSDLDGWSKRLLDVPQLDSVEGALRGLGLEENSWVGTTCSPSSRPEDPESRFRLGQAFLPQVATLVPMLGMGLLQTRSDRGRPGRGRRQKV
jgi:hypothetical protein